MMYEKLKADLTQARKNKDSEKVNTLSFIVGSLLTHAKMVNGIKTVSDGDVIAFLKKYVKNNQETLSYRHEDVLARQVELANEYLPTMMTGEELKNTIDSIVKQNNNMSFVMKELKEKFDGRYDGKEASTMVKERINEASNSI